MKRFLQFLIVVVATLALWALVLGKPSLGFTALLAVLVWAGKGRTD